MAWLSVSFVVAADEVEAVSDALLEVGAASVDVTDAAAGSAAEQPLFAEAGADRPQPWPRSLVSALFSGRTDVVTLISRACARAGISFPQFEIRQIAERDWVRHSRDQFAPIRVSSRLWIVPSWHATAPAGAVSVRIDPGLAFGTGSHPTTLTCLRWLERVIRGGESVLDYGCGSGILAIAAIKLGAGSAVGVDIDEQALLAARSNAMHNQVQASFHSAAGTIARPADIVVANILAHPLIVLAPLLAHLTAAGGRLGLAGLLAAQAREVVAAYEGWFDFDAPEEGEGWVLLSGVRKVR